MKTKAFTLIGLLVVVAILFIIFFIYRYFYLDIQNIREIIYDFSFLILIFIPYFYIYIFTPYLFIKDKRKFSVKFQAANKWKWFIIIVFSIGMPLIGFVAYNGMAKSQMSHDTKTKHAQTVRYISRELQKCKKDETTKIYGELNCSNYNTTSIIEALIKTSVDKNPYNTTYTSMRPSASNTNDEDVGYVNLSSSGSNIIIKSCHKTPCKRRENSYIHTVSVK